jgi:hypothetical protein
MENLRKLISLLQRYAEKNWYGQVVISFESGNIVNLKVTENIKL